MTALKPIDNRRVRGVAAERYPSNLICAHPDCDRPVDLRPDGTPTVHHIFPRSLTKSDSYFVEITEDTPRSPQEPFSGPPGVEGGGTLTRVVPHAVGLCGSGTTGHHGDIEEHRAWIKLEGDVYTWHDRIVVPEGDENVGEEWVGRGALDPQPGSREGRPKRKRLKGSARAARKTISVRLPEGVTGEEWDDLLTEAEEVELQQEDTKFDKAKGGIAVGKLLCAVLERFTGRA